MELTSFSTKNVKFFLKLEWHNPFGSVKDRAAFWMIKDAEKRGILKKDKSLYAKENIVSEHEFDRAIKSAKYISQLAYSLK